MDLPDNIAAIAQKIIDQGPKIQTEEATKNALIMPFIQSVLGYDVFNLHEVVPEFIADVGTKRGEKVDYAIKKDDEVLILIECKKLGDPLGINHAGQLFRYFSVTSARIAILTNGAIYQFYTDLDAPNRMDDKPFLTLDLLHIDDHVIPEVAKITKRAFDIDSVLNAAEELKYVSQIKAILGTQLTSPDDDFIRLIASRVYSGAVTQKVRDQFGAIIQKSARQFLNDRINERLKSALAPGHIISVSNDSIDPALEPESETESKINTTIEEVEAFNVVKAIVRADVSPTRIYARDTQSYFGVLLDNNNRKPICRLHFNRSQKYIGIFDSERNETRHPISSIDDIFDFADQLRAAPRSYDESKAESPEVDGEIVAEPSS